MNLDFEKWHGCHNDFLVLWPNDSQHSISQLRGLAPLLCNRSGAGVGADGLIVLHTTSPTQLLPERVTIINADGSLAATCGNGLRCAVGSIQRRHRTFAATNAPAVFELSLERHTVTCRLLTPNASLIAIEMGSGRLDAAMPDFELIRREVHAVLTEAGLIAQYPDWHLVSMPNPHVIFFVDELNANQQLPIGQALQQVRGGDGINVHFAKRTKRRLEPHSVLSPLAAESFDVLIWERGAGATQACGSGACAIALATGLEAGQWLSIQMPGGSLYVCQDEPHGGLSLAGPAVLTFQGRWAL